MTETPRHPPALVRRVLAVLVGLFATWELVFLPAANVTDFVPRRVGPALEPVDRGYQVEGTFTSIEPLQRAVEWGGDILDFWSEVSGQEQGWSMFAPGPPPYAVIPAVEFRFADGTSDTLLSPYEPADRGHLRIRPPLIDNRPFNWEAQFMYAVWYSPPEEVAATFAPPEDVARMPVVYRKLPDTVRVWHGPIRAWLAWRLKVYRAIHPERDVPVEVILKHRYIPTPHPNQPHVWTAPVSERPYARWCPADDTLWAYDAVDKQFRPVGAQP
jgi:hypothetical protein